MYKNATLYFENVRLFLNMYTPRCLMCRMCTDGLESKTSTGTSKEASVAEVAHSFM